jgi:LPS export ABC transporter protein LptC
MNIQNYFKTLKENAKSFSFKVFVLLSTLLYACESKNNELGEEYKGPVETIEGVEVKYSESGDMKVLMRTGRSFRYRNDSKLFPDSINVDFYSPQGAVITHLRADSGRYDNSSREYVVIGNVRVNQMAENKILTTSELHWNPNTKKVYTDKKVVVRDFSTSEITNAVGMDADQDFTHIIFRKATGIYQFIEP